MRGPAPALRWAGSLPTTLEGDPLFKHIKHIVFLVARFYLRYLRMAPKGPMESYLFDLLNEGIDRLRKEHP